MYMVTQVDTFLARFRTDGDAAAMEAFVRDTRPRLLAIARHIGSPQDADDAVQAAYHALLRQKEPPRDAVAWLVTTTVRTAYRRKAVTRRETAIAERLARPRTGEEPHLHVIRGEEDGLVRAAVHRLPGRYRDAVVLHHLDGLPLVDVARLLDVRVATAKTRVQRGRALLRLRLPPVLALSLLVVPWLAADAARAAVSHPIEVLGGVVKSKLAVASVLVVVLGVGVGLGVAVAPEVRPPRPAQPLALSVAAQPTPRVDAAPAAAPQQPPARRAERALTAEEVRQIVAEELVRHDRAQNEPPPPPPAANAEFNADPARREQVHAAVLDIRRALIVQGLKYDVGTGGALERSDPTRLDQFPDERVWPNNPLGWVQHDPARYEVLDAEAKGFDGTRAEGAWVFTGPLDHAIATDERSYATMVFEKGVGPQGSVTLGCYGTILCRGNMEGRLQLNSYATVIVEGDVTGSIVSTSYATISMGGRCTGSFEATSYANLRLLGGLSGKFKLTGGVRLYVGGYTPQSALDSIEFSSEGARATATLEASDLPPGKHERKPHFTLFVLEPK